MMTVQQLVERINKIAEAQDAPGITLWGGYYDLLDIAETLGGEVIEVAPASGCTSETCRHSSHSPAAPTYKWLPPQEVNLVYLDGETEADGEVVNYFAAFRGEDVYFIEVREPRAYHGSAQIGDVPDWALMTLAEKQVGFSESELGEITEF